MCVCVVNVYKSVSLDCSGNKETIEQCPGSVGRVFFVLVRGEKDSSLVGYGFMTRDYDLLAHTNTQTLTILQQSRLESFWVHVEAFHVQ